MKALLIAAGFGKRMKLEDTAKPLLEIEPNKPIIKYHLENLDKTPEIKEIIIATNNKFYPNFRIWLETQNFTKRITLLNNGKNHNDERLGSVNDILYAHHKIKNKNSLLIIQSDEFFLDFSFTDLIKKHLNEKKSILVCARKTKDEIKGRFGTIEVDEKNRIINVEEKPLEPKTNLVNAGVMILTNNDLNLIEEMGKELRKNLKPYEHLIVDRTGDYFEYAHKRSHMIIHEHPGDKWLDVGKQEQLKQAKELMKNNYKGK